MHSLREGLKSILRRTGLLPAARALRYWGKLIADPVLLHHELKRRRREGLLQQEFLQFQQQSGGVLRHRLYSVGPKQKRALVVSIGFLDGVKMELALIKGLELAGFVPVVLTRRDPWLVKYYELTGTNEILFRDEFAHPIDPAVVEAVVARLQSFDNLVAFEYAGARVGRFAASTALRHLRLGSLDLRSPQIREHLARYIASGMMYAKAAREIVQKVQPQIALFVDRGYTPQGEAL